MEKGLVAKNVLLIVYKIIYKFIYKMFAQIKMGCIFASMGFKLKPINLDYEPFSKLVLKLNNNTPPMPLHDAHLGGFLFL